MVGTGAWVVGTGACVVGTGAWVVGTGARVVGTGACVVGTGAWVVGTGACVVGTGAWVVGTGAWVVGTGAWVVGTGACVVGTGPWAAVVEAAREGAAVSVKSRSPGGGLVANREMRVLGSTDAGGVAARGASVTSGGWAVTVTVTVTVAGASCSPPGVSGCVGTTGGGAVVQFNSNQ